MPDGDQHLPRPVGTPTGPCPGHFLTLVPRSGHLHHFTLTLFPPRALGIRERILIGSVAAGERAADFLTLVTSAVRNDLDVWAYLKDVLDRLLAGSTDYETLRPDVWKDSHPEAVRQYRAEERRDRADCKQFRREQRRKSRPAAR